ncbi:MAG TPA: NADH-quinone oxidoreductase subunit J [Gemmataceae bacterium]|nr:NADH-quinone oxidoreductase subunit J [Gemmataceae bacterium]
MDLYTFFFWLVAGLTSLCAIAVVVTQNIVRAAAWLLFTLGGVAALFFLLGADFVGATQLLVYVGGTLVLVVFGVMLTAQGPFVTMKTGAAEWAIALVVGLLLYGAISVSLVARPIEAPAATTAEAPQQPNTVAIGESFLNVEEATPKAKVTGVPADKAPVRTRMGYLLPFEIVSVHLLVVLIGAAYLARAKRRRGTVS